MALLVRLVHGVCPAGHVILLLAVMQAVNLVQTDTIGSEEPGPRLSPLVRPACRLQTLLSALTCQHQYTVA
jgi:hypothetical protein